jgi:DNA-binding XRE family transcriptional regulator
MFDGMTQESVAFALGTARQHYCRMENAHTCPSLNTFVALAGALNISPYMLALTMEALD